MQESSHQARVELLIGQLAEEVRSLSALHQTEINRILECNAAEVKDLSEKFEKRLSVLSADFRTRISELQSEIDYLKEFNLAQRIMMEDNLVYTKGLESKLNASRSME